MRAAQKNHKTAREDITPWLAHLLGALTTQTDRARKLMDADQPEKLLSEKQRQVYQLFPAGAERGVAEINVLLKGKVPNATIKQALSRLVALKLLERIGQGRGTRYKKN